MRIDQALAILRRTGFVILVVASSLARAQAGPSPERGQDHDWVGPAVQVLEHLGGASATRVSSRTLDPPSRAAAAKQVGHGDRRRAHAASLAVPRPARRAAGSSRQGRSRAARSKARRARPAARRAARRRRRASSDQPRACVAALPRANTSSRRARLVDASTTRCGAAPRRRALGVRGCSLAVSRFTGAAAGRTRPVAAARPRRWFCCRRMFFPVSNPST